MSFDFKFEGHDTQFITGKNGNYLIIYDYYRGDVHPNFDEKNLNRLLKKIQYSLIGKDDINFSDSSISSDDIIMNDIAKNSTIRDFFVVNEYIKNFAKTNNPFKEAKIVHNHTIAGLIFAYLDKDINKSIYQIVQYPPVYPGDPKIRVSDNFDYKTISKHIGCDSDNIVTHIR